MIRNHTTEPESTRTAGPVPRRRLWAPLRLRPRSSMWLPRCLAFGVVLGLALTLAACRSPVVPKESAEGVVVRTVSEKEARFRAYSVEGEIELEWEGTAPRSYKVIIENVMAERTSVFVTPSNPDFAVVVKSPTVLEITLKKPSGNSKVRIATEAGEGALRFAVVGDSQGRNGIFGGMIPGMNSEGISFLVHLGDMTPTGADAEFNAFTDTIAALDVPYYPVPGNHDVRSDGLATYSARFGPKQHSFDWGGYKFVFLNDSDERMAGDQLEWLDGVLTGELPTFVFMHVPAVDPRGLDHSILDPEAAQSFMDLVTNPDRHVLAVFNGHVHLFDSREEDGVLFVNSGGGGAGLYEVPEAGGYHHYTVVDVSGEEVRVTPRKTDVPEIAQDLVLTADGSDLVLTPEELFALPSISAEGSYQNRFGNFSGAGKYTGILVKDLLELVGGMVSGEELVVYALDGYSQVFAYDNVFPESRGWLETQGEMVLAISMDDQKPPEWQDGYRIAFLPADGEYSNDDCAATSLPGQGWDMYESAGARWAKNVVRMEVRECQTD